MSTENDNKTDDTDRPGQEVLITGAQAGDGLRPVLRVIDPESAIAARNLSFKMRRAARSLETVTERSENTRD